jgi:hypothetical protein
MGAFLFRFFVTLIGLGLLAGAIAKAVPISLGRISLERTAPRQIQGSLSWVFCGIPIFRRSLDGLHHLERQDYTQGDFSNNRRRKFLSDRTVSRVGFMDAEGRTLAWSEKAFVFNAQSNITDFLNGNAPTIFLMEDRLAPLLMSDSYTTQRALKAFLFFALSVPCTIYGVRGMIRVLFFKPAAAGHSSDSTAPEAG